MTVLAGAVGTAVNVNNTETNGGNLVSITLTASYTPVYNIGISVPTGSYQAKLISNWPGTSYASGTTLVMTEAEADAVVAAGGASGYTPYVQP